ncbi:ABC transporter permease subunit [Caulobacter segnis]
MLKGAGYTVLLSVIGMGVGVVLGFGLGADAASPHAAGCAGLATVYVSAFRGTPLLVQLFLIYYGLPQFGLEMPPLVAAGIGFSPNARRPTPAKSCAAPSRPSTRASGRPPACWAMGRGQTLRRVILPQAARTAVAARCPTASSGW